MKSILKSLQSCIVFFTMALPTVILTIPVYIKHQLTLLIHGQPGDVLVQPIDALFLSESVKTSMVCWMVELSGKLSLTELQMHLCSKCEEHRDILEKFCRVPFVKYGSTIWRKDLDFRIENHVKEHPTEAESESHLKEIIQENLIPIFPRHISPWQILLINTRLGNTVLLPALHHSITDGVGGMNIFNQLLADIPGTIPQQRTRKANGSWVQLWSCATNYLDYITVMKVVPNTFMCQKGMSGQQTKSLAMSKTIPITAINKKKFGSATINSIICGALWEALSRYIALKGIPAPNYELMVDMPASLRDRQDCMPKNRLSVISVQISMKECLSIEERIAEFSRVTNMRKDAFPVLGFHIGRVVGYIASVHHAMLENLLRLVKRSAAASISNIAGPQKAVQVAGKEVKRMTFIPTALSNSGLSFGISSYNGELTVSIFDYPGAVDTELLMRLVDEVIEEMFLNKN